MRSSFREPQILKSQQTDDVLSVPSNLLPQPLPETNSNPNIDSDSEPLIPQLMKTKAAASTKKAVSTTTNRVKGEGARKYSLRPDKHMLETMIIASVHSDAKDNDIWNKVDDVRLIRLRECLKLKWPQIRPFFPGRNNDAVEHRYVDYLRKSKVCR